MTEHTNDEIKGAAQWLRLERMGPLAGLCALLGMGASLAIMFTGNTNEMMGSYLFALIFWASLTLAFFGLTLLHHTVRGSWGVSVLRIFEAGGGATTLTIMGLLFIPIVVNLWGGQGIYEWSHAHVLATDPVIKHKEVYLNPLGYTVRLVLFFAIWGGLAWGLRKSTLRQDESRKFDEEQRRVNWSAPSLVLFFLTMTAALTDWGMSLEPHWFSTIYPLWIILGQALGALALATVILCVNADKKPFADVIHPNLLKDLGNMLFVFTMLWGYTSISQYLIIWNGNLPEFTQFFIKRSQAWWGAVGAILIVAQFIVPFMALVAPRTKKTAARLAKIAGWIFLVRFIDIFYAIIPGIPAEMRASGGPVPTLFDIIALVGVGGVWFTVFAAQLGKAPLLPQYDNRLQEAKAHAH